MTISCDDLWCHIFETPTIWIGFFSFVFRKSKICNFDMSLTIKEYIFRFKISINDVVLVKVLQPIKNFQKVKFCLFLIHSANFFKEMEELSSRAVFKDKDKKLISFKKFKQFNNKLVMQSFMNLFFTPK